MIFLLNQLNIIAIDKWHDQPKLINAHNPTLDILYTYAEITIPKLMSKAENVCRKSRTYIPNILYADQDFRILIHNHKWNFFMGISALTNKTQW